MDRGGHGDGARDGIGAVRRLRPAHRALVLAVGVVWLVSCAGRGGAGGGGGGSPPDRDTPLIGLQRGGHWSVLTIRPPHLSGPLFHLMLKNSVLTGAISGGSAPGGVLRVSISNDGAEGFGPLGPVALDYHTDEQSTTVDGTWNGGRVHLKFARDSLHGTVASNSFFYSKSNSSGMAGTEAFRNPRLTGRSADYIEPLPRDQSCEYYLDQLSSDGALNGGSTCSGMPQQTRLEVPALAKTWLTHSELVTVLVAVLSAPPVVMAEEYGPRFDGGQPITPARRR
jgi:hypothetical protein